jgi:ribonuclease HII
MRPGLDEERRLWRAGHRWVAGLDEVGRGAWAGPVSVGVAVIRPGVTARSQPVWLRDSKLLAEDRRESVFDEIAAWCVDGAVGHASPAECDRWGMTAALRIAAYRALAGLEVRPDAVLIDGPHDLLRARPPRPPVDGAVGDQPVLPALDGPEAMGQPALDGPEAMGQPALDGPEARDEPVLPLVASPATIVPVVDGDARCASVAAASVLAKVVRDRLMRQEAGHFPAYAFERNKGYPSSVHQAALRGYGLSSIHRRSWAFVADLPWR